MGKCNSTPPVSLRSRSRGPFMISHPVIDGDPGGWFADYEVRCSEPYLNSVRGQCAASRRVANRKGIQYSINWPRNQENDVSYRFIKLFVSTTFALVFSWHANAADPIKVKLAEVIRSQLYIPMYVALSKGFAAAQGLEVELVTANGGDRAGALVLSGQADFALAGPEVAIFIFNRETPDKPL